MRDIQNPFRKTLTVHSKWEISLNLAIVYENQLRTRSLTTVQRTERVSKMVAVMLKTEMRKIQIA